MTTRFLSNLALALLGGFLVVATQAFALGAVTWLTFAIAIGALVVGVGMTTLVRDLPQRGIGAAAAVIGIWTIVASMVFAPGTVMWLGFASALAFVALAVAGLIAHELRTERVVHSLEVAPEASRRREPLTA
jgi:hypothetical protein